MKAEKGQVGDEIQAYTFAPEVNWPTVSNTGLIALSPRIGADDGV